MTRQLTLLVEVLAEQVEAEGDADALELVWLPSAAQHALDLIREATAQLTPFQLQPGSELIRSRCELLVE